MLSLSSLITLLFFLSTSIPNHAQASKSLDEINEQRVEKVNRLKIAEKERDNLSGSKLEAEAFIEKEKEIRRKKNLLYQALESKVNVTIAELQGKQEKAAEKLGLEKGKLGDTEKRLAVIQAEYEKVKHEHDRVQAELEKSTQVRKLMIFCALVLCGILNSLS
jgi:structural maintenance of chromosome 4